MTQKKTPSNKNDNKEHDTAEELKDAAYSAGEKIRKYATEKFDDVDKIGHDFEDRIRNEPIKAAAIALGIGFLAGFLSRRG